MKQATLPWKAERPCANPDCGKAYSPDKPNAAYCSPECKSDADRKRRRTAWRARHPKQDIRPRPCVECGKSFTPKGHRGKRCSDECKQAGSRKAKRKPNPPRPCSVCGTMFTAKIATGRGIAYCSKRCRRVGQEIRNRAKRQGRSIAAVKRQPYPDLDCIVCGKRFTPSPRSRGRNTKYCGPRCAAKFHRAKRRDGRAGWSVYLMLCRGFIKIGTSVDARTRLLEFRFPTLCPLNC